MPKAPPTKDEILRTLRLVTPASYHDPFFDDPGGAIAQYRGAARTLAELAKVTQRGASRQFFTAPPGDDSAGFATRATQTITLARAAGLDTTVIVDAGKLSTEGPRGRVYRSTELLVWYPLEPVEERVVELECDLLGEPGNLDYLASPDSGGLLLDPTTVDPSAPTVGSPALDVIDLQDLSQGRSGVGATLTLGVPTVLVDPGGAPTFGLPDAGLYVRFNSASNPLNVGRVLRILDVEIASTPDPDTGVFPRTVTLDDTAQPELVSAAIQDDGGAFTQYTAEARDMALDDVPLLPAVPVVGDAFYFGSKSQFNRLDVLITTVRYGELTLAWEFWDGGTWVALSDLVDGTDGFMKAGSVTFTIPPSWMVATVDTVDAFYVRARVDTFTSQTQQPLAARLIVFVPNFLAIEPDPGEIGWTILDWKDLGFEILEMTAPAGGRDDDLQLKLDERKIRRRPGESVETLRRRAARFPDAITPQAIQWEVNRVLEPFGLGGLFCDLGKGWTGLFWDVPAALAPKYVGAWDLYGPGDLFPEDKTFLPIDEHELRWHFWIKVPPPTLGEFGAAWDEGPPSIWIEAYGTFLGSAWDFAFTDGYPYISAAAYKEVYERVRLAKGGGIDFTIITGDVPVCP